MITQLPPLPTPVASLPFKRQSPFRDAELVRQIDKAVSLLSQASSLSNRAQAAASRLKKALIEFEIRQLKRDCYL